MHPNARPPTALLSDLPPLPRKRIPAPVPISSDLPSPALSVRKLPRRKPTHQEQSKVKAGKNEGFQPSESASSKPTRNFSPAITRDNQEPDITQQSRIFTKRNAAVGVLSLIIGGSLFALLLILIGLSGILDQFPTEADSTAQGVESFEIKPFRASPETSPPTSPSQTNSSTLPGLPTISPKHLIEPSVIPEQEDHFTSQAAPDSLSPVTNSLVPGLFEPTPAKEKSEKASDKTSREKPKETTKQSTNQGSEETSGKTTKRGTNPPSNETASSNAAKSHYNIGELDGSPRLLRHGSTTFPPSLASQGVSRGTVVFEVELSTSGSVSIRRVVSSTHPDLVAPARRVASGARFTPPKCNGKTVKAIMRWPIIIEK